MNINHLNALNLRLSNERSYIAKAKKDYEIELRSVWILQIEKEIVCERTRLGLPPDEKINIMSDEELLAELG